MVLFLFRDVYIGGELIKEKTALKLNSSDYVEIKMLGVIYKFDTLKVLFCKNRIDSKETQWAALGD